MQWFNIVRELEVHPHAELIDGSVVLREEQHFGLTHVESRRLVIDVHSIEEERRRVVKAELV